MKRIDTLTALMLAYGAASLLHFTHNAQFAQDYPNFPATITALQVYGAWLVVGATGLAGYLLMRFGQRVLGLIVTAVYAGLGFDGLLHYTLAPISAHSFAMNFTILTEVALAALLECTVLLHLVRAVGPATLRRP
jgi:uncharacterized membrane protein